MDEGKLRIIMDIEAVSAFILHFLRVLFAVVVVFFKFRCISEYKRNVSILIIDLLCLFAFFKSEI